MDFYTHNPVNNTPIEGYAYTSPSEIQKTLEQQHLAQSQWARLAAEERCKPIARLSRTLQENAPALAALMTQEMGKPITQSLAEIQKCAAGCEYYAQEAPKHLHDTHIATEASQSYIHYAPLGTILGIMPWNFPIWQVIRAAIPILASGNAFLLKHSPIVAGCAQKLEALFLEAGFPKHLFTNIYASNENTSALLADKHIAAYTLTGSTRAGRAVASTAGQHLKTGVLELGGSDPYIVLKDADLSLAAQECVFARMLNAGQSCIAAKRWIVEAPVYDAFLEQALPLMQSYSMGDPADPQTQLGPLAAKHFQVKLHSQVSRAIEAGATAILGCTLPEGPGAYYPTSILSNLIEGNLVLQEEPFGPVACLIRADNEAHALHLAKQTDYGLGAALFTQDIQKAQRIAREELDAGSCFINQAVHSDPRLPFGGIKDSGFGRELSHLALHSFVNAKTVFVR